ncbi:hypothetical protein SAMN05216408_0723 [Streptococcus equinus]|nr:hypothetical protein SAMN05216408_0723 [Streptococcus equinus]
MTSLTLLLARKVINVESLFSRHNFSIIVAAKLINLHSIYFLKALTS